MWLIIDRFNTALFSSKAWKRLFCHDNLISVTDNATNNEQFGYRKQPSTEIAQFQKRV